MKKEKKKENAIDKEKLLIATDSFLPRWDGISRFLSEIIPRLSDKYDITVIAPDFKGDDDHEVKDHAEIIRVPLSRFRSSDYIFPKFKSRIIKKAVKESDIVWTQTMGPIGYLANRYAYKNSKRNAAFIHSIEWELISRSISKPYLSAIITSAVKWLSKKHYNRSKLLLVPSQEVKRVFENEQIKTQKETVYLGTDIDKFKPAKDRSEVKKKIGIDPMKIVIGFHGRLGREKNLRTLYDAFVKLKKHFKKITLLIVGSGITELEDLFRHTPDVKFIGSTDKVVPYLQAMDIYVLPSYTETTSLF